MGGLALSWGRFLDSDPPWLEAYGDYTREFLEAAAEQKNVQDAGGTRLVQVETLAFGRRSWLKWHLLSSMPQPSTTTFYDRINLGKKSVQAGLEHTYPRLGTIYSLCSVC